MAIRELAVFFFLCISLSCSSSLPCSFHTHTHSISLFLSHSIYLCIRSLFPHSQTEGAKRWRLYAPPLASDVLASTSSGNYEQAAIGKAFADVTLETGDMLYLPRGTIHQALCAGEQHSMHATISTAQVRVVRGGGLHFSVVSMFHCFPSSTGS